MNLSDLTAIGVQVVGGQLDYKHQNIGFITRDGEVVLKPEPAAEFEAKLKTLPRLGKRPAKAAAEFEVSE